MPCLCGEVTCGCKDQCHCRSDACLCHDCNQLREHARHGSVGSHLDTRSHQCAVQTPKDETKGSESSERVVFKLEDIRSILARVSTSPISQSSGSPSPQKEMSPPEISWANVNPNHRSPSSESDDSPGAVSRPGGPRSRRRRTPGYSVISIPTSGESRLPIIHDFLERLERCPDAKTSKPEKPQVTCMSTTPADNPEHSVQNPDDASIVKPESEISVSSSSIAIKSESLPSSNKLASSQSPSDERSASAPHLVDLPEAPPEAELSKEKSQSSSGMSPSDSVSMETLKIPDDTPSTDKLGTLLESSSSVDIPENSESGLNSEPPSVTPTAFSPSNSTVSTTLTPVQATTEPGSSETLAPSSNSIPLLAMQTSAGSSASSEALLHTEPIPENSESTDPSKENLPEE